MADPATPVTDDQIKSQAKTTYVLATIAAGAVSLTVGLLGGRVIGKLVKGK